MVSRAHPDPGHRMHIHISIEPPDPLIEERLNLRTRPVHHGCQSLRRDRPLAKESKRRIEGDTPQYELQRVN